MEKLKQALEKAKSERDSISEKSVEFPQKANKFSAGERQFEYTQTQKLKIDRNILKRNRIIPEVEDPQVINAYKMLRTQLLQKMNDNSWNAIAVTSPSKGAGSSLIAVNLAISLSMESRHTVLLVDFDLKNPGLNKLFDFEPQYGISDHIINDTSLEDILVNPGYEGLVMLPGREPLFNSSESLSSNKMINMVNEVKQRYKSRIVIFDLPSILSFDDALAFSPYVDAFLLVLEEGKTKKSDIEHSLRLLEDVEVIGTVINKSKEHKAS